MATALAIHLWLWGAIAVFVSYLDLINAAKVGELVGDIYYEKSVDFPIEVGQFFTPEETIAQQGRFKPPFLRGVGGSLRDYTRT